MLNRRPGRLLALAFCGALCCATERAASAATRERSVPNDRPSLTLYLENDLFAARDRYYTSGFKLTYLTADVETIAYAPKWVRDLTDALPYMRESGYTNNLGLSFGQDLFTPRDTRSRELIEDDRPYAAWLYGAVSLHHKNQFNLHFLELTLGVVGPLALGEESQNTIHRWMGADDANGWDHQLKNEPGIILTYEYKRRFDWTVVEDALEIDCIPNIRGSAGNVLIAAAAGGAVRFGYNLPRDFHGNRIRSSGPAKRPEGIEPEDRPADFSLYGFAGVEGQLVGRDIFLDGNTWRNSHSVERRRLVGVAEAGIGVRIKRVTAIYTHVFMTKQFKEQKGSHHFGSLSVSYVF